MRVSKGLLQSYQLQDFCHAAALALRDSLTKDGKLSVTREDALSIKALVSAWESAQQRVAFHRRVPSPGVLKPDTAARPRRRSFSSHYPEPIVPTDAPRQNRPTRADGADHDLDA